MLTEMVEYGFKIDEKVKAIQNEKKETVQRTNTKGEEIRTQINGLGKKEEINIQAEENEETRIQKKKNRRGFGTSRAPLNVPTCKS